MVPAANLLQILKSAVSLFPEKSQSLLQPGRLNTVPLKIPLKFSTMGVKDRWKQEKEGRASTQYLSLAWRCMRQTHIHTPTDACQREQSSSPPTWASRQCTVFFFPRTPKIYQLPDIKGYRSLGLRSFHDQSIWVLQKNLKLMILNYFAVAILTWLLRQSSTVHKLLESSTK